MVLDSGITTSLGKDLRFALITKSWGNFLKKIGVISKKKKVITACKVKFEIPRFEDIRNRASWKVMTFFFFF